MNPLIVAVAILIPAAIVAGIIWNARAERQRKEELQKLADELGQSFSEKLSDHDAGSFAALPLAQRGGGRKHWNVLTADSGDLRIVVFDYAFTTGGGKHQQRHVQSVCQVTCPRESYPAFSLTPERFLHVVAGLLGFSDINFDDDPEFSRRYRLKGQDEAAIRALFTPERRRALMQWPTLHIEAAGHTFVFYEAGKRPKVAAIRGLMERGFAVYSVLKGNDASDIS